MVSPYQIGAVSARWMFVSSNNRSVPILFGCAHSSGSQVLRPLPRPDRDLLLQVPGQEETRLIAPSQLRSREESSSVGRKPPTTVDSSIRACRWELRPP